MTPGLCRKIRPAVADKCGLRIFPDKVAGRRNDFDFAAPSFLPV
jgi:hypothetical protein